MSKFVSDFAAKAGVLYLDYDGVLHPEDVFRHPKRGVHLGLTAGRGHSLFEHATLLASLLEPYPRVGIVLSTSWVRILGYQQAKEWLPEALSCRVLGATFHSRMDAALFQQLSRGQQVVADASRRRFAKWVALDDDADGWPQERLTHLIQTAPLVGLGAEAPQNALRAWLATTVE